MPRTDIHSPANLEPANYEFLTDFYIGSDKDMQDAYKFENRDWERLMQSNPIVSPRSNCHHCSAHYAYGVCYRYIPTGELINVGHVCAANTFSLPDRVALNRRNAERKVELARERARIAAKAEAFLAEHPIIAALNNDPGYKSNFVKDVLAKLFTYGELSPRQVAALEAAQTKMQARQQEEAANPLPVSPCPTGRVSVTGTVLSLKDVDTDFGTTTRMLVRDLRGFKVWGTCPRSLDCSVGDNVTFTANLEASCTDVNFGFFKRPTKASRN